jgi:N-acetylglucosamine kinase-like BadF-type ATPase
MKILIADSGSTKTDWRLLRDGKILQAQSEGLNPYFHSERQMAERIGHVLKELLPEDEPDEIHFYGAGLGEMEMRDKLRGAFTQQLSARVSVHTHSDMLAAARAAAGKSPGIVGIMGTGGNACYYDGENLIQSVPAPGYVFGDEGCGAWLGIQLLKGILRQTWPAPILDSFSKKYALSTADLLRATYKEARPNTFLAGFVPFLYEHIAEAAIQELVLEGFRQYIRFYLEPLRQDDYPPLFLVGGVAHGFQNLLMPLLRQHGFSLQRILSKPIAGLSLYHQEDGKFH